MSADEILLHIKDSYYFEVPKLFWPQNHKSHTDFPDVWVRLDPDFQVWQAKMVYQYLKNEGAQGLPSEHDFVHNYEHWKHEPGNHGKPVKRYLASLADQQAGQPANLQWAKQGEQETIRFDVAEYRVAKDISWTPEKIEAYNNVLSGKILIPQLPGTKLRNLYQAESGFAISKFMVIEFLVAVIISVIFIAYARRVSKGQLPRGWFWNLMDVFIVFLRNDVAKGNIHHGADKFVPLLWTLFFFVLGCNLFGLIPWMGSPTGSISVTLTLAVSVLCIGMAAGVKVFGPVGVFKNLIPNMELPLVIAVFVIPMMFAIEIVGLMIKHGVLGVRLLANMVAGHVVLLSIMGLVIELQNQVFLGSLPSFFAWVIGLIILTACVMLSCLELFVAFLQAYIFALLSASFINAETHGH
ncbi:F0F1 ATP synthase subunit A [bacterium]|nr:F0F1 ATP synthase subunit A [bacterium]